MEEPSPAYAGVLSENALVEQAKKIVESMSKVAEATQGLVNATEAVLGLEISQQKFLKWREMWLTDSKKPRASSQTLWGRSGYEGVDNLLKSIKELCEKIDREISKDSGLATPPQSAQRTGLSVWKWLFSKVRVVQNVVPDHNKLKDLVSTLSRQVDELYALSQRSFEIRHGVFGNVIEQTETSTVLDAARTRRNGSIALYRSCKRWNLDMYLGANLLGSKTKSKGLPDMQDFGTRTLYYQLFVKTHDSPGTLDELVLRNLGTEKPANSKPSDTIDSSLIEWPQMVLRLQSSETRLISTRTVGIMETHFFHVTKVPTTVVLGNTPENFESLAQRLDKVQTKTDISLITHFSITEGIELAYKIAECGFFLLGTPWLSNLSSKRIRLMKTTEPKRQDNVFEIRAADMEDVMDDQQVDVLLAVPPQLFQIGVLMAEIALGHTTSPNHKDEDEVYKEPSKVLPKIERMMGVLYCKATAFCLKDWGAEPYFKGGERRGAENDPVRDSYLTIFLEEYYVEVVRRLDDLREKNLPVLVSPVEGRRFSFSRGL